MFDNNNIPKTKQRKSIKNKDKNEVQLPPDADTLSAYRTVSCVYTIEGREWVNQQVSMIL